MILSSWVLAYFQGQNCGRVSQPSAGSDVEGATTYPPLDVFSFQKYVQNLGEEYLHNLGLMFWKCVEFAFVEANAWMQGD